jgi:S-adenosyl-L-methionine hydrolase (adenosine-forming)
LEHFNQNAGEMRSVTFLSDFGLTDTYVAEVTAVLQSAKKPHQLTHITHLVTPQDIYEGAFQLTRSFSWFPKGTIHLVVVDPGVGTERKCVYVKTKDYHFVGPDNGVLKWAVQREKGAVQIYELPVHADASSVFHGRDVFAPFVVKLLEGKPGKLKKVEKLQGKDFPSNPEIIHVDHYGNCVTSILVKKGVTPRVALPRGNRALPVVANYASIPKEGAALIPGSAGLWEIACDKRSASRALSLVRGHALQLLL